MIDEQSIKKVRETLDRELRNEIEEAFKPELTNSSRDFHAGLCNGLKQVLDELLGPNKDHWALWKPSIIGIPKVQENLDKVLETLRSNAQKAWNEALKPEPVSSSRDFHAGLCRGLNRGISLLDPNKKPNSLYEW